MLRIRCGTAQQHLQKSVDGGERRPQLMRGIRDETAHLLLRFPLAFEGHLKPLEHSIERLGESVDLRLSLPGRETDTQVAGIDVLDGANHAV
ncbi:hypothetical protein D3C77_509300 [compost metagenome]